MVLYPGKTKAKNRIRANSMNRKISQPDIPLLAVDDRVPGGTGTTGEGVGSAATGEAVGFNTAEGAADVGLTTGESVDGMGITITGEAVGGPITIEGAVDVGFTTGEAVGGLEEGAADGAILLL